ncbi:hypothetical protein REJC140_02526 [Pseudorhizobium endolithicum]|uniref:DUF1254 domain-containing protein n=1 Tax=Pseudorhizobium endolithicum TaxID=1191678 RepID=A0ABN7JEY7_9HYPH|nr:DUF1254 domain-containing protein [Pseudorhizobium endolithicum]CAD7027638.1 hypothetical protein REJC140_02526 [Pseudorhizobium endolithicum]
MLKVLFAVITGLVGAALLHLVIILALPYFSEKDAYTRVLAEGGRHEFHLLPDLRDRAGLVQEDPFMELAVCAYDISQGPIRIYAQGDVPFWSLGIYDAASNEVFSINDRTAAAGILDVVLATPAQLALLRKALPESINQAILVETQRADGYVVLRTMVPQKSFSPAAAAFLSQAVCAPFEWRSHQQF